FLQVAVLGEKTVQVVHPAQHELLILVDEIPLGQQSKQLFLVENRDTSAAAVIEVAFFENCPAIANKKRTDCLQGEVVYLQKTFLLHTFTPKNSGLPYRYTGWPSTRPTV